MRLLFIQGGSRLKKDKSCNYYTDGNLNNKIWDRYKSFCDKLDIVLRSEEKVYDDEYCNKNFNIINKDEKVEIIPIVDLMKPKSRFFSIKWRNKAKKEIEKAIINCDKAIIRSAHNFYTLTALKLCKKYKKPYIIEVAGYAFDGYWGHGDLYGKIVAVPYELLAKKAMKHAEYCVYVTNESLQKNYPCKGKTLGCSDVELLDLDDKILDERIDKINKLGNKIVIGTIGWVNLKLKGQHDVIKALHRIKKKNRNLNMEYQLVGLGDHKYLDKLIKKYDLQENVKILGAKSHSEIFEWLKFVDVYIQPSYQEGLCRAVIEAMSQACYIIVSNAGGNPELADRKHVFRKGNVSEIVNQLTNITKEDMIIEAKRSFREAKKYERDILDNKRNKFYMEFIEE